MYNEKRPLSGDRLGRLMGGAFVWLLMALLFCLSITMREGDVPLGSFLAVSVIIAFNRVRERTIRREAMRDQVWAEVVEQNPTAAEPQLLEQAETAWKREVRLDCLRLGIGAALAALLFLALMGAVMKEVGGRAGMELTQKLFGGLWLRSRLNALYTIARLGLLALTPFHALLILIHYLLFRKAPDFSEKLWDLPSPPDHTAVARPLPVVELSGDPQSKANRDLLTRRIRREREDARAWIVVWVIAAVLLLMIPIGLYTNHGYLAALGAALLFCLAGICLSALSTAYSLPAGERILRGLKEGSLRLERDEIVHKEQRGYINNLLIRKPSEKSQQQYAVYGVVTLERAGTYALGKGQSYYYASRLEDYTRLPESGSVFLVYVPNLAQPYMIVFSKDMPE